MHCSWCYKKCDEANSQVYEIKNKSESINRIASLFDHIGHLNIQKIGDKDAYIIHNDCLEQMCCQIEKRQVWNQNPGGCTFRGVSHQSLLMP
jgi:hypothetical protein